MAGENGVILIVDDDEACRGISASILEPQGYEVMHASAGDAVFAQVGVRSPDVILLGGVMKGGLPGFETCRRLKQDPRTAGIPVIIGLPLAEREDRPKAIEAGADDVVSKPYDADELGLRIRNAVVRTRQARRLQEDAERIQELEESRAELTQLVVREMKGPLSGLADLMELSDRVSLKQFRSEASRHLNEALEATETLEEMMDLLMAVRRLLAGEAGGERRLCDVGAVTRHVAESLGDLARVAGTALEVRGKAAPTMCDVDMVTRVVRYLLLEALRRKVSGPLLVVQVEGDARQLAVTVPQGEGGATAASEGGEPADGEVLGKTYCRLVAESHGGTLTLVEDGPGREAWRLVLPVTTKGAKPGDVPVTLPIQPLPRVRRYAGASSGKELKLPSLPHRPLAALGTRDQFAVAVALMSAIPLLVFGYFVSDALLHDTLRPHALWLAMPAIAALMALGIVVLVRHAIEVGRLRRYLELMAQGRMPKVDFNEASADFVAIERYLGTLIKQADDKIRIIESQSKALVHAEQQRVMVETVGAACHHLGQPATVIRVYLDLMKRQETSPEMRQMIQECQLAAEDVAAILHRLQGVAQYQTVPYRPGQQESATRTDERILKI